MTLYPILHGIHLSRNGLPSLSARGVVDKPPLQLVINEVWFGVILTINFLAVHGVQQRISSCSKFAQIFQGTEGQMGHD